VDAQTVRSVRLAPLYAAGFTTAFGAHSVAAGLGVETGAGLEAGDVGATLVGFGVALAVYDLAEVILKPVFGALSDRVGVKPMIVAGLVGFAAVSLVGTVWTSALAVLVIRFGQGACASAFSPASSAAVSRLAGPGSAAGYFGKYGSWKTLGYALGPLIGAGLMTVGGMRWLFAALALVALGAAVWTTVAMPDVPVLPRRPSTLGQAVRQLVERPFVAATLALAATTGSLTVGVGFLPLLAARDNLPTWVAMALVTVIAIASALTQRTVGRLADERRTTVRTGVVVGLVITGLGLATPALGHPVALVVAALLLGVGIGTVTPLGFAHLSATSPPEHIGRTMGNAEVGRELGDSAGPFGVGALAAVLSPPGALVAAGAVLLAFAAVDFRLLRTGPP